jgi:hypothetical protein
VVYTGLESFSFNNNKNQKSKFKIPKFKIPKIKIQNTKNQNSKYQKSKFKIPKIKIQNTKNQKSKFKIPKIKIQQYLYIYKIIFCKLPGPPQSEPIVGGLPPEERFEMGSIGEDET